MIHYTINVFLLVLSMLPYSFAQTTEPKVITSNNFVGLSTSFFSDAKVVNPIRQIDKLVNEEGLAKEQYVYISWDSSFINVEKDGWPEDQFDYMYIFYRNATGDILMVDEAPVSESEDLAFSYKYYFFPSGQAMAYTRLIEVYTSLCDENFGKERIMEYYDKDFHRVGWEYELTDKDGKDVPLRENSCFFNYDSEDKVYPTLKELLQAIGYRR